MQKWKASWVERCWRQKRGRPQALSEDMPGESLPLALADVGQTPRWCRAAVRQTCKYSNMRVLLGGRTGIYKALHWRM